MCKKMVSFTPAEMEAGGAHRSGYSGEDITEADHTVAGLSLL